MTPPKLEQEAGEEVVVVEEVDAFASTLALLVRMYGEQSKETG